MFEAIALRRQTSRLKDKEGKKQDMTGRGFRWDEGLTGCGQKGEEGRIG